MIDVFKAEKPTDLRAPDERGWARRIKASVLLAVVLFATAWQTIHYQPRFHIHSDDAHLDNSHLDDSQLTSHSETPELSRAHHSDKHDECLICQLQRQFSSVHIFHAPHITFSLEVKPERAAVFFTAAFYRSAESLPTGGRAPPKPFLS